MVIERITTVSPKTTDGQVIEKGDTVVFNADGKCFAGVYMGMSQRGAMRFKGKIVGASVDFNIMPKSIESIYKGEVNVKTGFPMNPPVESEDK